MTALALPPGVEVRDRPELRGRGLWPDLTWVRLDRLALPDWQRPVSQRGARMVAAMAEGFDPAAFGVLLVAEQDGRLWLIDGQHRALAALACGCVSVPCLVVEGRAAARFVAVNKARLGLSPLQVWRAEVAAGAPEAVALAEVVEEAGLRLARRSPEGNRPGTLDCVSLMRRVLRWEAGRMILEATLAALAEAGQGDGGSAWLSGAVVDPACRFTARLFAEAGEALPEDLDRLDATFADAPGLVDAARDRAARMGGRKRDHAVHLMAAEHARQGGMALAVGW